MTGCVLDFGRRGTAARSNICRKSGTRTSSPTYICSPVGVSLRIDGSARAYESLSRNVDKKGSFVASGDGQETSYFRRFAAKDCIGSKDKMQPIDLRERQACIARDILAVNLDFYTCDTVHKYIYVHFSNSGTQTPFGSIIVTI